LGSERGAARVDGTTSPWRLRLALCEVFEDDQVAALKEGVDEVRLLAGAHSMKDRFSSMDLFLEDSEPGQAWGMIAKKAVALESLVGQEVRWARGDQRLIEHVITPDGHLLRNLASLKTRSVACPEVQRWAITSSVSASGEAEGLIADTLAYWTGAVAGVEVLEVIQQPGESFDTLWARLGICRLLRWEAELGGPGDVLDGAGLFDEIAVAHRSS
jgi:hypothetical protein